NSLADEAEADRDEDTAPAVEEPPVVATAAPSAPEWLPVTRSEAVPAETVASVEPVEPVQTAVAPEAAEPAAPAPDATQPPATVTATVEETLARLSQAPSQFVQVETRREG
ncbi:MAG TPA: hypothetical protein VFV27_11525, partial [Nevskiaceae bacterium]|nr:hypothetical protein [Nevskiaceae bacterium]